MPDLETPLDNLRIQTSLTAVDKAYWSGYRQGKTVARVEVVIIVGVIALLYIGYSCLQ